MFMSSAPIASFFSSVGLPMNDIQKAKFLGCREVFEHLFYLNSLSVFCLWPSDEKVNLQGKTQNCRALACLAIVVTDDFLSKFWWFVFQFPFFIRYITVSYMHWLSFNLPWLSATQRWEWKANSEMTTHAHFSKLLPFIACLISTGTGTRTNSGCEARKVDCKPTACPAVQGSHFFFRMPPLGRLLRQRSLRFRGRPGKPCCASFQPKAKTSMTRWESRKLTETCPSSENDRSAVGDGRSFAISYM